MNCVVAVVDDSEIVLGAIVMGLEPLGWEVHGMTNAFGVVSKLAAINPGIILLDVDMPLISGAGLMKILNSSLGLPEARLILHSGKPSSELRCIARETSAHGFICKTDDMKLLDRKLRSFLVSSRFPKQPPRESSPGVQ